MMSLYLKPFLVPSSFNYSPPVPAHLSLYYRIRNRRYLLLNCVVCQFALEEYRGYTRDSAKFNCDQGKAEEVAGIEDEYYL